MAHPLTQQLERLRRRARGFVIREATARAVLVVVLTAALLALADYLVHIQDRGLRAILTLAALAACAVGVRRVARAIRGSRYRPVQVAQCVERLHPGLRGSLASAIEFLQEREDDPRAGSPDLRRAVVALATAEVERLDLASTIDARPARRAMLLAGAVVAMVALLALFDLAAARTAIVRLANPLNDAEWPRANRLVIAQPVERLPLGQTFEVRVVDAAGAPLPDDVAMHYRFADPDGGTTEEVEPMQLVNGMLLARRERVERPFEYRAAGGDDHAMPWTHLEVVEPPELRDASVTLSFPDYTGWPDRSGELHVRGIAGAKVSILATTTKPLRSATVRTDDEEDVAAAVSQDGYHFTAPADAEHEMIVRKSGTYRFDLVDREGFPSAAGPQYEIRAVPDAAPAVEIQEPKANIFVTPDATVPLALLATDDLAIQRIDLVYLRSDQSDRGAATILLDVGPDRVSPELARASSAEGYAGDRRELSHDWELKALGLSPGTQMTFHAAATDYLPQTAQSFPRRLSVVTPEEIQDLLADRQAGIFHELARVLELQRNARTHVAGLETQLDQTGKLTKPDVDALQGAGLNQQQVDRELSSDSEGVRAQIVDFLTQLRINKVDGPDTSREMQDMLAELARLSQGPLPEAARELTVATKAAQVDAQEPKSDADGTSLGGALKAAGGAQDEVIASLERMIADVEKWVNYRHFHREIGQLAKTQEEIAEETAAAAQRTLTRTLEDLDAQQRADLQKLAQRQLELARRLDRLEQRMDDTAAAARQDDPLVADTVADALAHARDAGVSEAMRTTGQNVEQNKLGQAIESQKKVVDDLRELLDILSNRREHELGRLVKKLREAEAKLAQLAAEHEGLRKKLAAAAEQSDEEARRRELERLTRQERDLEEEVARFARQLERLQADKASATAAKAGGKMGEAGRSGSAGDAAEAARQAADAQQDLEEAQQQLADQRRQAEVDLAQEQLARMEDAVASMRTRQEKLIEETRHYEQARVARGNLTRTEAASVREMARQQLGLRDESHQLAETLSGAEVFQFALGAAENDMTQAAARLDQRDTGDEAVRAESSALARLEQLLAALAPEEGRPQEPSEGQAGEGQGGGGQQQGAVRSVAELKLLKLIQEQINRRTQALDEARRESIELSAEQEREYAALSQEQGKLADMIANMMQVADEKPEDDPERLPDLRQAPDVPPDREAPEEKP
ncbi:MAG: hypothetical protein HYX69_09305 [Planctomycetia bacterium]|nr:hypothetical protein [Planctomycetia bacterium]